MGRKLKGVVGSKGKAQGRVRIILEDSEFSNFEEGEILVTEETRPNFVPIMKKAKAVITNTGGVLCHAAIISRELKIPCVVGVHGATKILKSGDEVEVDAEKGVVVRLGS